jgi:hypothetical protein
VNKNYGTYRLHFCEFTRNSDSFGSEKTIDRSQGTTYLELEPLPEFELDPVLEVPHEGDHHEEAVGVVPGLALAALQIFNNRNGEE